MLEGLPGVRANGSVGHFRDDDNWCILGGTFSVVMVVPVGKEKT
jgi:hypothetical protein